MMMMMMYDNDIIIHYCICINVRGKPKHKITSSNKLTKISKTYTKVADLSSSVICGVYGAVY